jgi:hypothetical protein
MKSKYIVYVTYKAFSRINTDTIPEAYKDYEIVPTSDIYMNMLGGWTEDECDNVAYIVERSEMFKYGDFKLNGE